MPPLLQIAIGGALGAVLRHASVSLGLRLLGPGFPWGTMAVNVVGSLAMGVVATLALTRGAPSAWREAAPFLMPGLLGGFTTFSAFSFDAFLLIERGRPVAAFLYVGGSVLLGLVALVAGVRAAQIWGAA